MLISNLYNFTAVWLVDRNAAVAHDEKTFFIVDLKEGNTSLVVDRSEMFSAREDRDILRIIPADRKTEAQGQHSGLIIAVVHGHRIVAGIAAEYMFLIRGEMHRTGSGQLVRFASCG